MISPGNIVLFQYSNNYDPRSVIEQIGVVIRVYGDTTAWYFKAKLLVVEWKSDRKHVKECYLLYNSLATTYPNVFTYYAER